MHFKLTKDEARREWVKALRSGEYDQGNGYLCKVLDATRQYCCLGIACEAFLKHEDNALLDTVTNDNCLVYADDVSFLPAPVQQWLGLTSEDGQYRLDSDNYKTLIHHNDTLGDSFAEIADLIESKPQGMFTD